MAELVLGPRSFSTISVLFLIEKHFTFMFIKILLSARYATHIKWFLKLFLEFPWKERLFEDMGNWAFPSPQLHHCSTISSPTENYREGHNKGAQGIHGLWRVRPSSKELKLQYLSWGRVTSQFTHFCLTLAHGGTSTIHSTIHSTGMGHCVGCWMDAEQCWMLVQRRHETTASRHGTCMEGQMKCWGSSREGKTSSLGR